MGKPKVWVFDPKARDDRKYAMDRLREFSARVAKQAAILQQENTNG